MGNEVLCFGDCAELVRDSILPEDIPPDTPYIGLEHIGQGTLHLNGCGKASDVNSNKYVFCEGDILFGKLRPYFRKVIIAPFNGICSTDIWVVRATEKCDQAYLFYWMASQEFVDIANQGSDGTKMPRAKWGHVASIKKEIPDMADQIRIGQALLVLDDKIELNQRMNQTLEAMARAIFKAWFVDFEPVKAKLKGEAYPLPDEVMALFPDELVESELGLIPQGWRVKPLDQIANFLNGLACQKYPAEKSEKNALNVLKIRELRAGTFDKSSNRSTRKVDTKYIINDGDVIFSWSGSLLIRIWSGGEGLLNQHLFKVTSDKYPKWFYYFWTKYYLDEFIRIASDKATTMGHIKRNHLTEALTIVPSLNVLKKADDIISKYLKADYAKSIESHSLRMIRDNILTKLFP